MQKKQAGEPFYNFVTKPEISVPLEVLDVALMSFGFLSCREGAQIAALAGLGILLARVETVLAGGEFANHKQFDEE